MDIVLENNTVNNLGRQAKAASLVLAAAPSEQDRKSVV